MLKGNNFNDLVDLKHKLELFTDDLVLIQYDDVFDFEIFKKAGLMYQGRRCFKNVVKLNNREPDPKGYIRNIHKVEILKSDKFFAEIDHSGIEIDKIEVKVVAKSFLWGQIRIMIQNMIKCALNPRPDDYPYLSKNKPLDLKTLE